jgi:hypothetical protein
MKCSGKQPVPAESGYLWHWYDIELSSTNFAYLIVYFPLQPIIQRLRDMARAHYDTAQVGGNHVPETCSSTDELDRLTGGVLVVEKKVTPVAGAETFCTSTFGSKKPTIMTGAIQVSAAIAPSAKTPPEFALENVHPTLAQEFTTWTESGESSSLHQHSHHFEYVQLMVHKSYVEQITLTISLGSVRVNRCLVPRTEQTLLSRAGSECSQLMTYLVMTLSTFYTGISGAA